MHQSTTAIRDTLFGDVPLSSWVSQPPGALQEPWRTLAAARDARDDGRIVEATGLLRRVAAMPALESRHYLEAWHTLRELGLVPPSELATYVYGVVVEVALPDGLDVLAAYADRTARYLNWSGAAVIWNAPDTTFDSDVAALLAAGERIVRLIGPWEAARPVPPSTGQMRLNVLTPRGLHFGEGPIADLARDPLAGPLFVAATKLMQGLTSHARK